MRSYTLIIGLTFGIPFLLFTLLLSMGRAPVLAVERAPQAMGPVGVAQTIPVSETAAIRVVATVGLDSCPQTATSIEVEPGAIVHFCYQVTNVGELPLTGHTLTDSQLGLLLEDEPLPLTPGDTIAADLAVTAVVTSSFASQAIWEAKDESGEVQATAVAEPVRVQVRSAPTQEDPRLDVTLTVGRDPSICATTDEILVPEDTIVHYCLRVTNQSPITLTSHVVTMTELGGAFPIAYLILAPSQTIEFTSDYLEDIGFVPPFFSQPAASNIPTVTVAITSADEDGNGVSASDTAHALVGDVALDVMRYIALTPGECTERRDITTVRNQELYYCLVLRNTGAITLTDHSYTDLSVPGISGSFGYVLAPNETLRLTQATIATMPGLTFAPQTPPVLGPFAQPVTATTELHLRSTSPEGYAVERTVSNQVRVPDSPLSVRLILMTTRDCPQTQTFFTLNYGNQIWYCIRLTNSSSTPLTHHRITQYITPPVREGSAYFYSATVEFVHPVTTTQMINNDFLTATVQRPAIFGPFTVTQPLEHVGRLTNTLFYSASNPSLGFEIVQQVVVVATVAAGTPTPIPTITPTPVDTPTPVFASTPTPTVIQVADTPTWTPSPVVVSALAPPTSGTPQLRVTGVTTPLPGQFNSPLENPAALSAVSPLGTPTFTPDYVALAAAQTADAAFTATSLALLAAPLAEPLAGMDTETPTPPPPPTETPSPTETPTPTSTQRPVAVASPLPTTDSIGLLNQAAGVAIAAAGWIWFIGGSLVFFITAGIIVGLSFRQQERRRYRLSSTPPPDVREDVQMPGQPRNRGDRADSEDDHWPASLR
jgi:hypothetical protein